MSVSSPRNDPVKTQIDPSTHFSAKVLRRFKQEGFYGLGESYIEGEWEAQELDSFLFDLINSSSSQSKSTAWLTLLNYLFKSLLFNPQKGLGAFDIGKKHYDLGNDLFEAMLDKTMTYTCGYWKEAQTLQQAQEAKLELVCAKLGLQPGMHILDIGCGWGNFAQYAAKNYGVKVTGLTVSKEQKAIATRNCWGLPVEIELKDYRDIDSQFDHIVSLEMIEAVGKKNMCEFFGVVKRCLKPGGLFLLQAISAESFTSKSDRRLDQFLLWIVKHIFPDGYLPNSKELVSPIKDGLLIQDWHSFGLDYDYTLLAWAKNFEKAWPKLKNKYGENFARRWRYYLYGCAALFRAELVQLYQIVYSKEQTKINYIR